MLSSYSTSTNSLRVNGLSTDPRDLGCHICLTKNKILVWGGGGGDQPHIATPNTLDLLLLLFYPTVSLDFGCYLISKLTIHSPRMVNQSLLCTHTRLDAMLSCIWDASMPPNISCIISNSWQIIFIHHINMSKAYININFHTLHVIKFSNNNTQKSIELGPQSNKASSDLNI